MPTFHLGLDPFTSPMDHYDAQAGVFLAWARWRRAVLKGRDEAECIRRHAAYVALREATDASRAAAVASCRPMPVDVLARLRNLPPAAADLLLALCVLGRTSVRRAIRDSMPARHLRPAKRSVPIDVLFEVCALPEATAHEALRALLDAGLCAPAGRPAAEGRAPDTLSTMKVRTWLRPGMFHESLALAPRDPQPLASLVLPDAVRAPLERALEHHDVYLSSTRRHALPGPNVAESRLFIVVGPRGAGKETLARAIAAHAGLQFHGLRFGRPSAGEKSEAMSPYWLAYCEVDAPASRGPDPDARRGRAAHALEHALAFATADGPGRPRISVVGVPDRALLGPEVLVQAELVLELESGGEAEQRALWRQIVPSTLMVEGADPGDLATVGPLTPGHMVSTLRRALREATGTRGPDAHLSLDDLRRAMSVGQAGKGTGAVAPAVEVTLDRLVLAHETRERIEELVAFAELKASDIEALGMPGFTSSGAGPVGGAVALFVGPPGTGKTACAAAIAHRLGRPLVSANLGELLGRFVGESEGNVQALFEEARRRPSVLFFDEADALLSARRADSVNAHENRLVNLLLVELERHDGPVLLATNFGQALDPALARRIQFHVPFGPPDEAARRALWALHLPETLPGAGTVDLDALAREFPLTGAQIRNIARRCALRTLTLRRPLDPAEVRALAAEQLRVSTGPVERTVRGFRA